MRITEASDALLFAMKDIAKGATEKGLKTEIDCYLANRDLERLTEADDSAVRVVAAEMTVSSDETEEKIVLECALSVEDGEVQADEMLREVNTLRDSMREILEKLDAYGNAKDAFAEICKPEDEEVDNSPKYDNKTFYIAATAIVLAIFIIILIFK